MREHTGLIHLHSYLFDHYQAIKRILHHDPELIDLYHYTPSNFHSTFKLSIKTSESLYRYLHTTSVIELQRDYSKKNIKIITINSDLYPKNLKEITDPPFVLYSKGHHNLLKTKNMLSIIGARRSSHLAKPTCESFLNELIKEGWIIVSGLALGCDTIAHQTTIDYGGSTIAVIGSGHHYTYPKENKALYEEMSKNQLIISEYPYHIKPAKHYFPRRNRIIAGLSRGVIVLEAKEKSGSMITANFAIDYNREVFAVPGPIIMEEYKGNHRLIQEGAKLITASKDIIEEFI